MSWCRWFGHRWVDVAPVYPSVSFYPPGTWECAWCDATLVHHAGKPSRWAEPGEP